MFVLANQLYGEKICSYYFDIPFEETLERHKTRPSSAEFGEDAMRRWWLDKKYSDVLVGETITKQEALKDIIDRVMQKMHAF